MRGNSGARVCVDAGWTRGEIMNKRATASSTDVLPESFGPTRMLNLPKIRE
jgi:hypothetical protein